jgi:hypothetical protein
LTRSFFSAASANVKADCADANSHARSNNVTVTMDFDVITSSRFIFSALFE